MKNKKGDISMIAMIIIIVVVIAITAGVVVWLFATKLQAPTQQPMSENKPIQAVQVPATQSLDATANWQTYQNDKYGFEIKYPKEASVLLAPHKGVDGLAFVGASNSDGNYNYGVTFNNLRSANNLSAEKWYAQYYENAKREAAKLDAPFLMASSGEGASLNGYQAYKTSNFNFDKSILNIYVVNNNSVYKLSYNDEQANDPNWNVHEKLINQMLSTFKFTK